MDNSQVPKDISNPNQPFLIVNGTEVFPLNTPEISIGRFPDNDLVINDQRISRHHARLTLVDNVYHILDLHSTGGTTLNGKRVQNAPLKPGDILSLAGIPLIYGEHTSGSKFGDFKSSSISKSKSGHPTISTTKSQELDSIDRYIEMFENKEEEKDE